MTDMESELLDEVENIRQTNNRLWMNLVRLALKAKPVEARAILEAITDNDRKVSNRLGRLCNSTDA
jgi:hypothetical protein